MSPIKDQAQIDEMRKRLYERGGSSTISPRSTFSDNESVAPAAHAWPTPPTPPPSSPLPLPVPVITEKRRFSYRLIILLSTLILFFGVIGSTSLYLYFGNNQISSKNIEVTLSGLVTAGGGEVYPLEVTIENKNTVPIESAVLIINFPSGTKSAEENPKDLLEERVQVDRVNAGEKIRVPVKAIVFGEENQDQEIRATLEYRLAGSNGTFDKDAAPLAFKIISSPLVIRVISTEKVSAGQETTVTLTVQSNASTPLKNILITAEYPENFDFTSADPVPAYRENSWLIKELAPEKSTTIKLKGIVGGQEAEQFQLKFQVGTPQQNNQFLIGSVLAKATADYVVEQPFIDVELQVNGTQAPVVTLVTGERSQVVVTVRNTLSYTLYDMKLEVAVAGNVLVRENVVVESGYFDTVKDIIRFDPSSQVTLVQVPPGESREFRFTIMPSTLTQTPSFAVTASVLARRISERSATEQLIGSAKTEVKYTSSVAVASQLSRGTTGFIEVGPIPPQADTETTYTITLDASAGGNDVTGGVLTTSLPQYVAWKNVTKGDGTLIFNPVTKEVTWTAGDIEAGKSKQISFQVGMLASQNQVDTTPALLTAQRFRATDRFTGAVVRTDAMPVNTVLPTEAGFPNENGRVVKAES